MNEGFLASLALFGTGAYFAVRAGQAFPAAYAGGTAGTDLAKRELARDAALAVGTIAAGALLFTMSAPRYRHYGAHSYWEPA